MKKNLYRLLAIVVLCSGLSLHAQQVNTQYFLENVPTRHYLNPAFQPMNKVYVSLPVLSYMQFGLTNNSLSLSDVVYNNQNGQPILFLNPNNAGGKDKFYKALRGNTMLRADFQTNILGFGFRTGPSYWNFSLMVKVDGQASVPKDLFKLGLYGTPDMYGNKYDLKHFGMDVNAYLEAGLGYSREINDKWTVGGKVKFLYGLANASTKNNSLELSAGMDKWTIKGDGMLNVSSPLLINIDDSDLSYEMPDDIVASLLSPPGLGAGIDLGVTYKPIEALTLSASIVDLGFIRWRGNPNNITYKIDYEFDGLFNEDTDMQEEDWMSGALDTIMSSLSSNMEYSLGGTNPFTTSTSPKLNVGAEYSLWNQKLNFGLLSRTMLHKSRLYEELTVSMTTRPVNWFNFGLSYSILNGKFGTIGAGIGLRTGILHWHWSADYVSLNNARLPIDGSPIAIPVPYKAKGMNFAVGVNFVFGSKPDKDRDGVKDKFDLCPDTPRKVKVDANGCPIDTDGDGVPDYLDKCPDTPREANGMVDEYGCLLDTDGDGVPDYLDKCPDTPQEAYASIDSHGCPIDTDGDGVPDYLDKCPDTPAEAWGHVDEHGCPLDTDGDGVPDYLDKCPNTPQEAYGMIDENGCPIDTDGDGVPDYLDKCPDTPAEARKLVDEYGCPLDTDGDGIPDYLDDCPRVFGTKENKGCPEVKKEVRSLFQRALQGIQFESGKDVIKKTSYAILDQIATVMIDNPTYRIEIQGHTDNTGKKETNQVLSEKRANAVRDYLIKKGVAENRITAVGYGDSIPIAPNTTTAGRAKNRRVEFIVSFEEVSYQ